MKEMSNILSELVRGDKSKHDAYGRLALANFWLYTAPSGNDPLLLAPPRKNTHPVKTRTRVF